MTDPNNMTLSQAKTAMRAGKPVTHKLFTKDEFFFMRKNVVLDENEMPVPEVWKFRQSDVWQIGWSLYFY